MSVWMQKCTCGFDFTFGVKPKKEVEVQCPKCKVTIKVDLGKLTEVKEKGADK